MNEDIFLTQEGIEKLKLELDELKGSTRTELAKRLRSAIQMGDLSENADYISAKEEQSFVEGRILELEEILKRAKMIEQIEKEPGTIQIGSEVVVREEGYDDDEIYSIVGSKEANPDKGKISYESPIGKSLLNHRVGDIVRVKTPDGFINFKVIEVR
ncbi:MAG: transcription elongation factor GreA [Chloroflexi bacterium]|nr:transcription elongation factor GreA [Chloroflexota bacterium]